jgi:electron transfer flavoprotein alpha subunit
MLSMAVKINLAKCTGCGRCVNACPMEVIKIKDNKALVDDGCAECGACISACPRGAILL